MAGFGRLYEQLAEQAAALAGIRPLPMAADILGHPKQWQDRAEEARALAELMTDDGARRIMLKVATKYDELAKRAEKRALSDQPIPLKRDLP